MEAHLEFGKVCGEFGEVHLDFGRNKLTIIKMQLLIRPLDNLDI